MSYSRWGINSVWYTYYACSYSYERDEQQFDVCGVKCFSYKDLKENQEWCFTEIKTLCPESTEKEILELKGYMQEFMSDVEHDIALNLVQDIKKSEFRDLPDLYEKLKTQTAEDYEELLEDIRKILYDPATEKKDLKTNIGQQLFEKKLLIPIKK
jgi:hypothetical protein